MDQRHALGATLHPGGQELAVGVLDEELTQAQVFTQGELGAFAARLGSLEREQERDLSFALGSLGDDGAQLEPQRAVAPPLGDRRRE